MADTLLIVDDNPLARKMLHDAFMVAGYHVLVAANGREALELAQAENPDLILLDIVMPQMDGIEVCRRLRANPRTVSVTIVMLTVSDRLEDKLEAFRAGADDFLVKPMNTRELVSRVAAALGRARRLRADAAPKLGKLFTFFSAKGGVGTTSVCINVAAAMARLDPQPLLVVDFVLPMGSLNYQLGVEARSTLAYLGRHDPATLDRNLVQDHLYTRDKLGFHVLMGARDPKEAQEILPASIEPLFKVLRELSAYTLVDMGRSLSRISLPILTSSERLIVVLSPDPVTVRLTKTCLDYFQDLGVPPKRLTLVMNLPVGRHGLHKRQVEDLLKLPIQGVIPYEADSFVVAANQGIPLVQAQPDCTASLQIMDLARHLVWGDTGRAPV